MTLKSQIGLISKMFAFSGLALLAISPVYAQDADKKLSGGGGVSTGDKKSDSSTLATNTTKFDELKVSVDADRESLVTTLRELMKSVKADYTIESSLNDAKVSMTVKDIPFKTAFKLLLNASTLPVEWNLKDDIFHFKLSEPKSEPEKKAEPVKELPPLTPRIEKVSLKNSDAKDTLDKLLGKFSEEPAPPIFFNDTGSPGRSRSNFFRFVNGRLITGSGATGPNGNVQGGASSVDVGRLIRQFLRFP